mmetsp:Transcript_44479/g.48142  ORF Transcript_44479/g.48142 Transcript_44479/m.48142 type:complete len:85 (-) Transcript_44479:265-519(-)
MVHPLCGRYVMARITDDYLQGSKEGVYHHLLLLLQIRYAIFVSPPARTKGRMFDMSQSDKRRKYRTYTRDTSPPNEVESTVYGT